MESVNIPRALAIARKLGFQFDIMSTSFVLSRRLYSQADRPLMPRWQQRLLIALARNIAADVASYFQVPMNRMILIARNSSFFHRVTCVDRRMHGPWPAEMIQDFLAWCDETAASGWMRKPSGCFATRVENA
jgi:hypothetical protein